MARALHNYLETLTQLSRLSREHLIPLLIWVDKKNLIEFSFNFVYYLYNYYMVYAILSHAYHVTSSCDVTLGPVTCDIVTVMWYFPVLFPCVVSPKEKKKKRNINNDIAILPSYDTTSHS